MPSDEPFGLLSPHLVNQRAVAWRRDRFARLLRAFKPGLLGVFKLLERFLRRMSEGRAGIEIGSVAQSGFVNVSPDSGASRLHPGYVLRKVTFYRQPRSSNGRNSIRPIRT